MISHLLLTRFCLTDNPAWHADRMFWFKKVYVPSIKEQTAKNFKVVLMADEHMPDFIRMEAEDEMKGLDYCIHKFKLSEMDSNLKINDDAICAVVCQLIKTDKYIVSRCDNDDALGRHYIQTVQKIAHNLGVDGEDNRLIDLTGGCIMEKAAYYQQNYDNNMFISLFLDHPFSIYSKWHTHMHESFHRVHYPLGCHWMHTRHRGTITQGNYKPLNCDTVNPKVLDDNFPLVEGLMI